MTLSVQPSLHPLPVGDNVHARVAVACTCAASAGVHAGLVPEHLREAPPLGVAFALSATLFALAALVIRQPGPRPLAAVGVMVLLLSTALAYVASRTTGIPILSPVPEPADALGASVSVLEVAAAAAAIRILPRKETR
jgi:drug/metabolite transporter (DMT)-like permease